jgi:Xaa-Pro dipeptidase
MRKSAAELAALRRSIALCDAAQRAVAETAAPGMTRAAVQDLARAVVERATGPDAAIVLEASWGEDFGQASWHRPLREGDLLLTDIAPRLDGYWGDSCNTRSVGPLTASQRAILDTLRAALAAGTEAVRAGVAARAVDAVMRERVGRSFPVYAGSGGHGIGLDYHEPPRLTPAETLALEENMVIALEPGIYLEGACARLEHLVRVTSEGCEVLSRHLDIHVSG